MHRRLSGGPRDLVQELSCAQDYLAGANMLKKVLKKLANDCAEENAETSIWRNIYISQNRVTRSIATMQRSLGQIKCERMLREERRKSVATQRERSSCVAKDAVKEGQRRKNTKKNDGVNGGINVKGVLRKCDRICNCWKGLLKKHVQRNVESVFYQEKEWNE